MALELTRKSPPTGSRSTTWRSGRRSASCGAGTGSWSAVSRGSRATASRRGRGRR